MEFVDFGLEHIKEAAMLVQMSCEAEREHVPCLPKAPLPPLDSLANGLGVVALENGKLMGFLGAYGPFEGMFGTAGSESASRFVGVFSPVHAHAAAKNAPVKLWQRLYQHAAEKWRQQGAAYHAVALFAHDRTAQQAFFDYGFGKRCVDAVCPMQPQQFPLPAGFRLQEGTPEMVRELRRKLDLHLRSSPCFMKGDESSFQSWLSRAEQRDSRLFCAMKGDTAAAFVEVGQDGENYLTEDESMQNICGAYCEERYRGTGLSAAVLHFAIATMQQEGFRLMGVDYESFNPTAAGFWAKHFTPYTCSLVRRIDSL